jgi:hypothetical protein
MIKRDPAGVWSNVFANTTYFPEKGIYAANNSCVWQTGTSNYGTGHYLWKYTSSLGYVGSFTYGHAYAVKAVTGFSSTNAYLVADNGSSKARVYETVDGTNWTEPTGFPSTTLGSITFLHSAASDPPVPCSIPKIGSDFSLDHYLCLPNQHLSPTGGGINTAPFSLGNPIGGILRNRISPPSGSIA